MKLKNGKIITPEYYIYIAIVVLFGLLCFQIPILLDDYWYGWQFKSLDLFPDINSPIRTIYDTVNSFFVHYQYMNGRLPNLLTMLFNGIWDKNCYNIFATILFALQIPLVGTFVNPTQQNRIVSGLLAIACLSIFGSAQLRLYYTGISHSINYLLSCTTCLVFAIHFNLQPKSNFLKAVIIFNAFISGWTHEGIVAPILASLFFWVIIKFAKNVKISSFQKLQILFFTLGSSILFASPGLYNRLIVSVESQSMILKELVVIKTLRFPYLLLLLLLLFYKKNLIEFIKKNIYLFIAWGVSLMIIIVIGGGPIRTFFFEEFLSMCICLRLLFWGCPTFFFNKRLVLTSITTYLCFVLISVVVFQHLLLPQYEVINNSVNADNYKDNTAISVGKKHYVFPYFSGRILDPFYQFNQKRTFYFIPMRNIEVKGFDRSLIKYYADDDLPIWDSLHKIDGDNNLFASKNNYFLYTQDTPATEVLNMNISYEKEARSWTNQTTTELISLPFQKIQLTDSTTLYRIDLSFLGKIKKIDLIKEQ